MAPPSLCALKVPSPWELPGQAAVLVGAALLVGLVLFHCALRGQFKLRLYPMGKSMSPAFPTTLGG